MIINNQAEALTVSGKVKETIVNADGSAETGESLIVHEHFIDLIINEQLAAKLVCSPSDLTEMVIGRMAAEGYIESTEDVESIYICEYGSKAKVYLQNGIQLQQVMENEPTCCTGNQVFLANVKTDNLKPLKKAEWKKEWIFALANEFANGSRIHKSTKGTHCCYLCVKGEIIFAAEDIGRHNAMDKAIGYAVMQGYNMADCILFTTGRVPTDMVRKAVGAGIPILVSKAVPTDQAIEMAAYYNLTLICKAWPDRFEIFHEGK